MIEEPTGPDTTLLEGLTTYDTLAGGLRSDIQIAISRKKRKTNGEHRWTVKTRTYWHFDKWQNPELVCEGYPIVRLLVDGIRLDFPPSLPQRTLHNRIQAALENYKLGIAWHKSRYYVGPIVPMQTRWGLYDGVDVVNDPRCMEVTNDMLVPYYK